MTEGRARFETDVSGVWGLWPTTPARWSYSSLKEIEACPSKWMLSRADYPDIWKRRGYPPLPAVATIFGDVVHGVVERLAKELGAAGITSPRASDAVGILGSLGGWREIVLDAMERELSRLNGNPRVSPELATRVREELVRQAPAAADQVKVLLGRGAFRSASDPTNTGAAATAANCPTPRAPAGTGGHAEQEVTAEALRLTGRIDLLFIDDADVTITDFKTGLENDSHDDQVRFYSLLWYSDAQVNPARRMATKLRVAYAGNEHAVAAPDSDQLRSLRRSVASRVAAADLITQTPPPMAIPSEENCRYCDVKHLCDAYWADLLPAITDISTDQWFDFEGRILRQNGSRSWFAETATGPPVEVLVRTLETDVAFKVGGRIRLLGVRRSQDPDDPDRLVISMVGTSEWYLLSS